MASSPHLTRDPVPSTRPGDSAARQPDGPRRLAQLCALAGLAIALYLSLVHLTTAVPLACAQNSIVNCEQVVTSPASVVLGVPVAFYGVLWFLVMALLLARRGGWLVQLERLGWSGVGILTVLYLVYSELFVIGAVCLWCSAVHLLVLVIFAVQVLFPRPLPDGDDGRRPSRWTLW